ncbi:hypothetical protein [Terrihabitans sp. B22-R8]|uniref:hypothetical protein n=1 Tax=Terrihabitans sp. B22-R8 TaxID=3425128 RepID=UPI00403C6CF1
MISLCLPASALSAPAPTVVKLAYAIVRVDATPEQAVTGEIQCSIGRTCVLEEDGIRAEIVLNSDVNELSDVRISCFKQPHCSFPSGRTSAQFGSKATLDLYEGAEGSGLEQKLVMRSRTSFGKLYLAIDR